jgi:cell division septum initiation protein DivIVA
MTAPVEPADADQTGRLPWTAATIRSTHFSRLGRGGRGGYDPAEVDPFIDRMVTEATKWEQERDLLVTEARALREAKAARDDPRGPAGPSVMAVDAMVRATAQAEHDLAAAREELRQVRQRTRAMWDQAEAALAHANEATGVPTEPELPDPPRATDDLVANLEARTAHLQECKALLDAWERAMRGYVEDRMARLVESRGAWDDQRAEFVAVLDGIEAAVPDVRAALAAVEPTEGDTDGAPEVETPAVVA